MRLAAGLTRWRASVLTGFQIQQFEYWEDYGRSPSLKTLARILDAFGYGIKFVKKTTKRPSLVSVCQTCFQVRDKGTDHNCPLR